MNHSPPGGVYGASPGYPAKFYKGGQFLPKGFVQMRRPVAVPVAVPAPAAAVVAAAAGAVPRVPAPPRPPAIATPVAATPVAAVGPPAETQPTAARNLIAAFNEAQHEAPRGGTRGLDEVAVLRNEVAELRGLLQETIARLNQQQQETIARLNQQETIARPRPIHSAGELLHTP
eukprot:TRINITY_DN126_c0_g1_i2.p2 TRINITY_DN126_c0_g1~~TRINITY_DN126_c0_g1_i2.p2  ORF type:complete len:174 (+),score=23.07 TRINITY_DN126_c0_g1_i2:108-629(+)